MYFLVRKKTGRGSGEALEAEYQGTELTLGSDDSAMVQMPGLAGVLQFKPSSAGAQVSASKLEFELEGKSQRKAELALGQTLSVAGYELSLFKPPAGFVLGLQVHRSAPLKASFATALDLSESAWSVRRLSWILALLILSLGLIIPLTGVVKPELAQTLRTHPLPDDSLWSTGPLDAAHDTSGIAKDCQACHSKPFVMVEDAACLDCHRPITEHVDVAVHPAEAFVGERCASCHREHNEPQRLVRSDNKLCVDCHADNAQWPEAKQMEAVTAFSADQHPDFKLSLLSPKGKGAAHGWEVERVRRGSAELEERSNLKFSHEVHLDHDKVQSESTGEALNCASCHSLKDDRQHFEPISMDKHCRSCHSLSFDMYEPELELPHGDLRAAIVAMESHFIREFTDPALRQERSEKKPRRVPGKREAAASCEGSGLDCGRAEALKEAEYQFAQTGCITCHEVLETGLQDISDRWYVQPIRISGDWYPKSRFDHKSHLSIAWSESSEVCEACHDASQSKLATDILIPGQDNCLECHDQGRAVSTDVGCVSCHAFHQRDSSLSIEARGLLDKQHPAANKQGE
ncbi:hypothetical protein H2508_00380 [Parahaliea sp. F7430]|uniref:Doubled CXXCH motif domain-containing protein n=1 Tax=Sediminihaliea albiluteola TaxID=2758564 RepID=A0A7W2YI23_9GAMM|nr:cytochrome c3 family protein [Sediminihaliea albiluteola]MBA6411575.1 hypothetical protein [Sediminihaliea albiluteola]